MYNHWPNNMCTKVALPLNINIQNWTTAITYRVLRSLFAANMYSTGIDSRFNTTHVAAVSPCMVGRLSNNNVFRNLEPINRTYDSALVSASWIPSSVEVVVDRCASWCANGSNVIINTCGSIKPYVCTTLVTYWPNLHASCYVGPWLLHWVDETPTSTTNSFCRF